MLFVLYISLFFVTSCTTILAPAPPTLTPPDYHTAPGMEKRVYEDTPTGQLIVFRVDPALYRFRSHYRPGEPLRVGEWRDTLPDAAALINTNFFDIDNRIVGLLVADGVVYGQAYQDRGGMFAVQGDEVRVRSNTVEPYTGESLEQAVQAFPMLVLNGEQAYTSTAPDRITRRTVIGQDREGHILLMIATASTLVNLSAYLSTSELEISNAFNLDGGGSSLMYTALDDFTFFSFDPVPAVLAVYPR